MTILQDLKFAARRLVRDRRFTLAAIAALALGIGATSAVFTLVNAVLLRTLPFDQPERIMMINTRDAQSRTFGVSEPDFEDWRRATRTFSGISLVQMNPVNFSADDRVPDQYDGVYISWNGFSLIGTQAMIGRGFSADDDRPGAPAVVLLSHKVWQSRYGGDKAILGRTIRANSEPATIVGVMAPGMEFPFNSEVWLPLAQRPTAQTRAGRSGRLLMAYGRLADGMTIEQARTEMSGITEQLAAQFPDSNKGITAVVTPFSEQVIGTQIRILFWSLMGAVAFVLLIACANVANLLLARAADRSREIAVRVSIGATRWRIVRQLLVESVLLAFVAGVAGLGLAYAGVRWFDANTADIGKPYWMVFTMDPTVFVFFAAVCLVTGIVFGLAPALYISRTSVTEVMKDGGRSGSAGLRARRWTTALIVAELTLTLVLLSGAGLMIRSFMNLYQMDIGIDTSKLVSMQLIFPTRTYSSLESRALFLQQLDDRLNSISAIEGASTTNYLPFSGASQRRLEIDGRADMTGEQRPLVGMLAVGSRYFDALGVRMVRGRAFNATDGEPGREAMIINQRLAEMHFRGEDPVGKRIRLINDGNIPGAPKFYQATVVGISPTIRQRGFERDPDPVVYITHAQNALMAMGSTLLVRARGNPVAVTALLRQEISAMDPDVPVTNIRTMDDILARNRWPQRTFGTMFLAFAVIAIVLAAVGLYSVTAYSVAQRTQEIGIRMALGAEGEQVRWLILRRGMIEVGVGLCLGIAGALGTGRLLQGMLVGTGPSDVVTLVAISLVLITVAVMACFWPARRATRLDPVKALRYQ
jgi:putative ABC transport system permease protein